MENFQHCSNEEMDIKPIVITPPTPYKSYNLDFDSSPKKWGLNSLQDSTRKSAFLPYKQSNTSHTVLTNLQRGNTQAETPLPDLEEINLYTQAGQGEIAEEDITNENIELPDNTGLTLLHWASAYGQYNTVELLLNHNANVNQLGPEEETPLILASNGGHHEIVRLLIRFGAEINHVDHLCNSALMYAAKGNHSHTCQELLLHGAEFALVNLNDETAHDIAVQNNCNLAQSVIENFILTRLGMGS